MTREDFDRAIEGYAERISLELGARAKDNKPITDNNAVNWLKRELTAFALLIRHNS